MNKKISKFAQIFDQSAKTGNRMQAVHCVVNGKPLDESLYDEIFYHLNLQMEFSSEDRVLEVGVGSGLLLERIAKVVKQAIGTDISSEIIKLIPQQDNISVFQMNSDNMIFKDNSFDKVVCNGVFQYFPNQSYAQKCLAEMMRVCKPDGKIFIGDIFNASLKDMYIKYIYNYGVGTKIKGLLKQLIGKPNEPYYLFLDPCDIREWSKNLGCSDFNALLQVSLKKPLLHRMFRYDVLIKK